MQTLERVQRHILCLVVLLCALAPKLQAVDVQEKIVQVIAENWQKAETIEIEYVSPLEFNPRDGLLYFGIRHQNGGIFRLEKSGKKKQIVMALRPSSLTIHPDSGDIFFSEDFRGTISKVKTNFTWRDRWISGFSSAEARPAGIAIVPFFYRGIIAPPGAAISTILNDPIGSVYKWSTVKPEDEIELFSGNELGHLHSLAINDTSILLAGGEDNKIPGGLFILEAPNKIAVIQLSKKIENLGCIAFIPGTNELLVTSRAEQALYQVNIDTGNVKLIAEQFKGLETDCIATNEDGSKVWISDYRGGKIYAFTVQLGK